MKASGARSGGAQTRTRYAGSASAALLIGLVLGIAIGASGAYIVLRAMGARTVAGLLQAELLPNAAYVARVSELISNAKKSVYVVMYVMKYDPREGTESDPANRLVALVAEAAARGLDVRVIVDDVTKQSYPETIAYLKSRGVPVRLDPKAGVTTHAKIVIVDGECAVVGSHNWTESALSENNELSVLLCSEELVSEVSDYFMRLWESGRPV